MLMLQLTVVVVFSTVALCSNRVEGVSVEVLAPSAKSGTELVVVIIPGSGLAGEAYRGVGKAIQASSSFRMWVAITKGYEKNFATYPNVEVAVNMAFSELTHMGVSLDRVFIAGHSMGGVLAQDYAFKNKQKFKGVLLFGSYLPKWVPIVTYPLPVLTISGDLDGMTRLTRLVDTFKELSTLSKGNRLSKPIVIVPDMNHGHFADPPLPSEILNNDIQSPANRVEILSQIGGNVDTFIIVTLGIPYNKITNSVFKLQQAYIHAETVFKPLQKVKDCDVDGSGVSNWSIKAQELVAGINTITSPKIQWNRSTLQIENKVMSLEDLVKVNAHEVKAGSKVKVSTYTHLSLAVNTLDRSLDPQAAEEMLVMMESQANIRHLLPSVRAFNSASCKDINQNALQFVLGEVSPTALTRWNTRSRKITWHDDVGVMFEDDWFNTPLNMTDMKQDGDLEVTSTSWSTAPGSWPFPVAGVQYCKLMSPFRVMEWIYIDSLRYTNA